MAYLRRRRTKQLRAQFDARTKPGLEGWHEVLRKPPKQIVPAESDRPEEDVVVSDRLVNKGRSLG